MHREIIRTPRHLVVDHINHNGLDNRKANLRPATRAQNNYNRLIIKRKDSSSKYKGVSWKKEYKKWQAQIYVNGQFKFLGYFEDEIQAAKAYDEAAKKYYGRFACLNFPKEIKMDKGTSNSQQQIHVEVVTQTPSSSSRPADPPPF
jgi:hypothetical protein